MKSRDFPAAAVTLLLTASCDVFLDREAPAEYDDPFAEVRRVEFQEFPDDPIVGIDYVSQRPGGGYLIADPHAGRVRLFDAGGRQTRTVGQPGKGPGELEEPAGAVEFPDGRLVVVQRGDPRLTIFPPDTAPVIGKIPGHYGFWAARAGDGFVAGVATVTTRFGLFDRAGTPLATFGLRDPAITRTPFWMFFASDHAAVLGDAIAVNMSFFPTIRLYDFEGDSIGAFGEPPPDWVPISEPPVSDVSAPGNRERLEEWSTTFTVVRQIAAVADSLLVVQYGHHAEDDVVVPTTADVYSAEGQKLAEGLSLPGRVVGGGSQLLVLVAEPPSPWTVSVLEWRGRME